MKVSGMKASPEMTEMGQSNGNGKFEIKMRLEMGTMSPQGTASTQPYGFGAKASSFQPSGGTPKSVKNWTTFVPLGVPSLSSLGQSCPCAMIHFKFNGR